MWSFLRWFHHQPAYLFTVGMHNLVHATTGVQYNGVRAQSQPSCRILGQGPCSGTQQWLHARAGIQPLYYSPKFSLKNKKNIPSFYLACYRLNPIFIYFIKYIKHLYNFNNHLLPLATLVFGSVRTRVTLNTPNKMHFHTGWMAHFVIWSQLPTKHGYSKIYF